MDRSLSKVGLQPSNYYDTPNGLVAGNTQAHTIRVNMVPILKNIKYNLKCIMLKFHYNNNIVKIRGLTILGFKRRGQTVNFMIWIILEVVIYCYSCLD